MKQIIAIAMILFIASCAKKTNPVTPNTPNNPTSPNNPVLPSNSRFIPNWQRDTLVGQCVDVNGDPIIVNGVAVIDTIITYTVNDTSLIEHNGVKYYIWWRSMTGLDTFENNARTYVNCEISTTPDTSGVVNQYLVSVNPYRYWDDFYQDWGTQDQTLWGHSFHKKYKVWNSIYLSY